MHRVSLRVRPLLPETKPSTETCEPGSDCARSAIERVKLMLLLDGKKCIPYSLKKKGNQG